MSDDPRNTFPVRFRNPRNREGLRQLSQMTGTSMNAVVERAVERELVLMGADLEYRLERALETVRSYGPERDLEAYIDAAAAGELEGDLGAGGRAVHAEEVGPGRPHVTAHSQPAMDVISAFARG